MCNTAIIEAQCFTAQCFTGCGTVHGVMAVVAVSQWQYILKWQVSISCNWCNYAGAHVHTVSHAYHLRCVYCVRWPRFNCCGVRLVCAYINNHICRRDCARALTCTKILIVYNVITYTFTEHKEISSMAALELHSC